MRVLDRMKAALKAHRRHQGARRKSIERCQAAFEQSAVGMLELRQDGSIIHGNQKYYQMLGYSSADTARQNIALLSHPEDAGMLPQACLRLLSQNLERLTFEQRFIRRDGGIFWTEVTASLIATRTLKTPTFLAVVQDQTSPKGFAAELCRARAAAAEAARAKAAFLANISHEIRTPLNAILGFTEILADHGADISNEDRIQFTATLRRNGRQLAQIIEDILDLSLVEAGKCEVQRLDLSLPKLITDVTTLLDRQAQDSGIQLCTDIDGAIPERICSDPVRLRQILTHVIGNAIKFTKHGTVKITLKHLKHTQADDQIAFIVQDSGCGIAAADQAQLFHAFSQVDTSTTRRVGGAGLGLALSRRLAQLLGGNVTLLSSELHKGSTFVITIPVGQHSGAPFIRDLGASAQPAPQVSKCDHRLRLSGLHILLAEDAVDNQMLIRSILAASGATVDIASDGLEVLAKAWAYDYDVILMDLQMPRLDGYDATASLRQQGYRKPIIALTAQAMKEDRERALKAGVNDHLSKPVSQNQLTVTIAQYAQATKHTV